MTHSDDGNHCCAQSRCRPTPPTTRAATAPTTLWVARPPIKPPPHRAQRGPGVMGMAAAGVRIGRYGSGTERQHSRRRNLAKVIHLISWAGMAES